MKTIFLHGLGQSAADWERVTALIPGGDFDCPSLYPASGEVCTYAEILRSLTERLDGEREPFCLCGISLGAILALDYAISHSDRVTSLVLIGCQYQVPTALIDLQNLLFRCMSDSAFREIGLSKSQTISLAHSMRKLDFRDKLNKVSCPTVVLCGKKDKANRKASIKLNALLPQSELFLIPGAGHEVNKDAPEAIAARILENLKCFSTQNDV